MIVVSDTSPITNLAGIRRLDILRSLFGEVVIPDAVRTELLAGPDGLSLLQAAPWIRVEALRELELAAQLEQEIDAGEAAAIALAVQVRAELLLIDERRGSLAAERQGLRPIGLVGVLLEAKRAGIVEALRPLLDELVGGSGFYLHRVVYERAIRAAGETIG